jgi:ATP-dependent RNA helicase DeaD
MKIPDDEKKIIDFLIKEYPVLEEFKTKIKTIFHHLTKEELVEKILANYLSSINLVNTKPASKNKRQKQ